MMHVGGKIVEGIAFVSMHVRQRHAGRHPVLRVDDSGFRQDSVEEGIQMSVLHIGHTALELHLPISIGVIEYRLRSYWQAQPVSRISVHQLTELRLDLYDRAFRVTGYQRRIAL